MVIALMQNTFVCWLVGWLVRSDEEKIYILLYNNIKTKPPMREIILTSDDEREKKKDA
jgi:hypothetical protein